MQPPQSAVLDAAGGSQRMEMRAATGSAPEGATPAALTEQPRHGGVQREGGRDDEHQRGGVAWQSEVSLAMQGSVS